MPFNKNSLRHVVLTPDFARSWIGVFLSAPAIHEIFSIQGRMHPVLLCSWPVETVVLWSTLLPTAPCLTQDGFKSLISTAGGEETMHGPTHEGIVFLYSCLSLRHDHTPKKKTETNLFLTN